MKTILCAWLVCLSLPSFAQKLPLSAAEARELIDIIKPELTPPPNEVPQRRNLFQRILGIGRPTLPEEKALSVVAQQRVAALLAEHSTGMHYSESEARLLAAYLGVKPMPSFDALSPPVREESLNQLLDAYTRLPLSIILTLKQRKKGIDVVADNVTTHPTMGHLANQRPRNWEEGTTFADVPGVGAVPGHANVIAANSLYQGHGSVDLVLHEVGHGLDRYLKDRDALMDLSNARAFRELNRHTPFERLWDATGAAYQRANEEESFAEMLAMYYSSYTTRDKLAREFPDAITYFEENLPRQ